MESVKFPAASSVVVDEISRVCQYSKCDVSMAWEYPTKQYCCDSHKQLAYHERRANELGISITEFNRIYVNKTEKQDE